MSAAAVAVVAAVAQAEAHVAAAVVAVATMVLRTARARVAQHAEASAPRLELSQVLQLWLRRRWWLYCCVRRCLLGDRRL